MIHVKNVSKQYGHGQSTFDAIKSVSFKIDDGETVALVGKSGSGKSTLMHLMSGLDHPSDGTIVVDGKDLSRMKSKDKDEFRSNKMSFIFQSFFVEANQTTYQNMLLPLEIARVPREKRAAMINKALKAVELGDKSDTLAGNLSGGQKQRLGIARAIVNEPSILFADEPTGNLDSVTGGKIITLLFELNKTLGCTVVIVTHDQDLAKKSQRQIELRDGEVV